jgi:mono/diheme cytochrome c family protein
MGEGEANSLAPLGILDRGLWCRTAVTAKLNFLGELMFKAPMAALFFVACIAAALNISTNSHAQAPAAVGVSPKEHAGEEVFNRKCLQCHAVHEGQYSFGPNLEGEMKKNTHKKTAAEIRVILKDGKGKMPSFADKLTPQEIDDLLAYIRTL